MRVGTKSVLFGAHCWFIHPWFVAAGWCRLYGFPLDPRLWVAFFVHDLGYFFKTNMDGPEGERHVEFGASIMGLLFDRTRAEYHRIDIKRKSDKVAAEEIGTWLKDNDGELLFVSRCAAFVRRWVNRRRWRDFSLYHSRFYAKRDGVNPSKLCAADKLAVALEPWWLYLPRVILSGEINEYMAKAGGMPGSNNDPGMSLWRRRRYWFERMTDYLRRWCETHKDGRADTWTPDTRRAVDGSGVWQ